MRIAQYVILIGVILFLQGCSSQFLKEFAREIKGFEERHTAKETPKPAPAVYCYNTLGSVTCYEKPQPTDSDSRYVGTSAESVDPVIQENHIEGNTALPAVKVDEEPASELPPVFPDESKEKDKLAAEPAENTIPEKTASEPAPAPTAEPSPVQPDSNAADAPANRPLYDPYLNQLEEKPVDPTIIKPPPPTSQQPIVPPKKKSKKKVTETKQ